MVVCVPVTAEGLVDQPWGSTARVAVADVLGDVVVDWQEFDVRWDELRAVEADGPHLARVAHFLREHGVQTLAAYRVGDDMLRMLFRMGLHVHLGAAGDARDAARVAAKTPAEGAGMGEWRAGVDE